jgi:hypothetical protein
MKNKKNMLTGESFILRHLVLLTVIVLCLPVINLGQGNNAGQKLSEVTHDTTLTGKGTTDTPLGVANGGISTNKIATGAITSSKLATGNVPQVGQVLSFNGTGLSWQTPTAALNMGGALRVVDTNGAQVGLLDTSSNAIRYINSSDIWLKFSINKSGIFSPSSVQTNTNAFAVFYTETSCQGQPFMTVGKSLFVDARIIGMNAYFPSGTGEIRNVKSFGSLLTGCSNEGDGNSLPFDDLAPMQTVLISNFGTPPFNVSQ